MSFKVLIDISAPHVVTIHSVVHSLRSGERRSQCAQATALCRLRPLEFGSALAPFVLGHKERTWEESAVSVARALQF